MGTVSKIWLVRAGVITVTLALAACAPKPAPAPPPPPPVIVAPPPPPPPRPMPTPPRSSAPNLTIPDMDASGRRLTPNVDLTPEQALWQLRIALNVAALNCRGPDEAALVANYTRFLNTHRAAIARSERTVIAGLGRLTGTNGIAARDALSTRLYNYFAQPPVHGDYCRVATEIMAQSASEPAAAILPFAAIKIGEIDQPFVDFYNAYDNYRRALAEWQALQPAPLTSPDAAAAPASAAGPAGTGG